MFVRDLVGIYRNDKSLHTYIVLMVCIALTLLALFLTSIHPTQVEVNARRGSVQIHLPLNDYPHLPAQKTKEYDLSGFLFSSFLSQHIVNITLDGCIKYFRINRVPVTRDKIIHGKNCDSLNGFDIDVGKYLKHGNNTFEIVFIASDGSIALSINNSYYDQLYLFLISILILEIIALLYFFLKNNLQLPTEIIIVIVLGVLIRIVYLSYTLYTVRTYDAVFTGGHLDYIKYVANNLRLPNPDTTGGWEYHQAPLYYIIAALVYKISLSVAPDYPSLLQVVSLVYFTIFLIFGVLILRILCKSQWLFFTSTALLVFWPSGIIHSIRIGNDPMYYMVSVIGLYFLLQWIAGKQEKHFYLATLFAALAIATKLSGLIWLGILGCFFVLHILKKEHPAAYLKKTLFLISVLALALCFSLGRNTLAALHDSHFDVLNGNSAYTMSSGLAVKNNVNNYLSFDFNIYLTKPFTNTWTDAGGRQYFWNFFLKSMLFGEFSFPFHGEQALAIILSLVLLLMVFFFFVGFLLSIRNLSLYHLFILLWLVFSLLSLISYRHTYSFSSNGDFQFIFPAIIPFIYFYLSGIQFFMEHKFATMGKFGYVLVYLFIAYLVLAGNCLFLIIPLFLVIRHYFFKKYKFPDTGIFGYIMAYLFVTVSCIFFIIPLVS